MASWNAIPLGFDHRPFSNNIHGLHKWMNRNYPRVGRCEWCATTKRRTTYATAESGHYTRNRADWLELCYRCHNAFDGHARNLHGFSRRGEWHGRAKLTWPEVDEIRRLLAEGSTQRALGERFGVSAQLIFRIAHNEIWLQDTRPESPGK